MALRKILTEPNKLLRQISKTVETVGDSEKKLMDDMLETMYASNGIGLAAIQIGVPKRIIVIDISDNLNESTINTKSKNVTYANEITNFSWRSLPN